MRGPIRSSNGRFGRRGQRHARSFDQVDRTNTARLLAIETAIESRCPCYASPAVATVRGYGKAPQGSEADACRQRLSGRSYTRLTSWRLLCRLVCGVVLRRVLSGLFR